MEFGVIRLCLLTSVLVSLAMCGCRDDCHCRDELGSLKCDCSSPDFACAVSHLDNRVTSLKFTTIEDGKEPIRLQNATLNRFSNLTHLSIATPIPEREILFTHVLGLDKSNTFEGLRHLREFAINLLISSKTSALHQDLFVSLLSLEELDLSYTQMLSFSELREAFYNMKTDSLKKLIIRNVQSHTGNPNFRMNLNLTWFLEPLERMPLEVLDFSRNALLRVTPGILRHTSLKEVYFHENFIRFTSFFTEVFLHPTVEVAVADYQGCQADSGYKITTYREWLEHLENATKPTLLPNSSATQATGVVLNESATQVQPATYKEATNSPVRGIGSLACRAIQSGKLGYFPFFENIDCSVFPDYDLRTTDPACFFGIRLPIGPKLRELHAAHFTFFQGGYGYPGHGSYCFNPYNNLRLMDFASLGKWGKIFSKSINGILIKGLTKLEVVSLENADVNITNTRVFSGFPDVKIVNLRGNRLHLENDFQAEFFANNTKLRKLILSNCGISMIHTETFSHLNKLQVLDLSENKLTNLSFALPNSGQIQVVLLMKNEIQTLQPPMRKLLDNIARYSTIEVDLSDNPLSCACVDIDFMDWMQTTRVTFRDASIYQCQGSKSGSNLIMDIDLEELDSLCNPSYVVVICASVLSTLGVVGVLLAGSTLYRKRYSIMHWKYRRFTRPKLTFHEMSSFRYDAFIVYNSDDKWWTHHALLAEMEDRRQLKLCIYLRDFPAGGAYADVIEEAMQQSRKTVLILSPKFFDSHWCLHEMSMAHNKLVAEGVDLTELVILTPLSSDVMTNTLTQLMQHKTALNWTEDPDDRNLFLGQTGRCNKATTWDSKPIVNCFIEGIQE